MEGRKFKRFMGYDRGRYQNVCACFMGVLGVSVQVCVCVCVCVCVSLQ